MEIQQVQVILEIICICMGGHLCTHKPMQCMHTRSGDHAFLEVVRAGGAFCRTSVRGGMHDVANNLHGPKAIYKQLYLAS